MIELKPLYLCIDTSKALPLITDVLTNIDLDQLKIEPLQPETISAEIDKS